MAEIESKRLKTTIQPIYLSPEYKTNDSRKRLPHPQLIEVNYRFQSPVHVTHGGYIIYSVINNSNKDLLVHLFH